MIFPQLKHHYGSGSKAISAILSQVMATQKCVVRLWNLPTYLNVASVKRQTLSRKRCLPLPVAKKQAKVLLFALKVRQVACVRRLNTVGFTTKNNVCGISVRCSAMSVRKKVVIVNFIKQALKFSGSQMLKRMRN